MLRSSGRVSQRAWKVTLRCNIRSASTSPIGAAQGKAKKTRSITKSSSSSTSKGDAAGRRSKQTLKQDEINAPLKPKRGRPRKDKDIAPVATKTSKRNPAKPSPPLPPRLLVPTASKHHHDLPSFLAYASRTNLSQSSNVYKGTHYEYTVSCTLTTSYNFHLQRTGRSNDLGIDLVGYWDLPFPTTRLKVLIQCKASAPQPAMIRELEGAYLGAPAGWNGEGEGVLALLVAGREATRGVRDALQRSRWPMGLVLVEPGTGTVRQFLWNAVAAEAGLEGLGVGVRYGEDGEGVGGKGVKGVEGSLALTWMGKLWKSGGLEGCDVSSYS